MRLHRIEPMIENLRRVALRYEGAGITDGQLLERFVSARDEVAFEALVRRHGPMVWGVCHRLLRKQHDTEDAFQATFLVLARKAAAVFPREMVGNWLYGVAHTTALRARAATAKLRVRERQVIDMPEPTPRDEAQQEDLQALLDQELKSLPDHFRTAIVLCDLEGRTRAEVARQLKIPEGTLSSRLTTGRRMLAKKLARHGAVCSGGALATILSQNTTSACVSASLVGSTVKAAASIAAGKAVGTVLVSAKVAALTEGVMKTMFLAKLKMTTAVLVLVSLATTGIVGFSYTTIANAQTENRQQAQAEKPKTPPDDVEKQKALADLEAARAELQKVNEVVDAARNRFLAARERYETAKKKGQPVEAKTETGVLRQIDAAQSSIYVEMWKERTEPDHELLGHQFSAWSGIMYESFTVAKDATIFQDNVKTKLTDLTKGSHVALKFDPEGKNVVRISADGGTVRGRYVSANESRNTIAVVVGKKDERKNYHLVKETEVLNETGKAARVKDLKEGTKLLLTLSAEDVNTTVRIETLPSESPPR
jgi:RNA polymerase sigma factor (sigma-70 family)